jgi:hypothetical protein
MTATEIITLVTAGLGVLSSVIAHVRINRQPATPSTPGTPPGTPAQPLTIGHGLLLELFRQALQGGTPPTAPPAVTPDPTPPATPGNDTASIIAAIEGIVARIVEASKPVQPATPKAA